MKTIFKKWLDEFKEVVKTVEQREKESAKKIAKEFADTIRNAMAKRVVGSCDCEPMLKYRFLVEFPEELEIPSYWIKSIDKPKFMSGTWQTIQICFIDILGPSTSRKLYELKNDGIKSFSIKSLDPTGVCVEEWKIDVNHIISIDFGTLDREINEIQNITMVINPSNCTLV